MIYFKNMVGTTIIKTWIIKKILSFNRKQFFKKSIIAIFIFLLGAAASYLYIQHKLESSEPKDIYSAFLFEIYEKIQENYWNEINDEQLNELFKKGSEKITGKPYVLSSKNKIGLQKMLFSIMKNMNEKQKKEFSTQLANIVLANLEPFGRSGLYSTKQEQELQQRVQNINPETGQIESTVFSELIRSDILYLQIKTISPTTLDDLKKETEKFDKIEGLDSLILDLRANVGGSLDALPYLLGPFIGQNEYAFELFRKGKYEPYKTVIGWLPGLVRYKKVVILIDENTQSSAEVMATALKRYNVGVLVGKTTKGWGTIEKVFELENQIDSKEKYSMFLVHRLSIGENGQPIEGKGINPLISIDDPNWQKQLFAYFPYQELIDATEELLNK